jgi:hypothetical protein
LALLIHHADEDIGVVFIGVGLEPVGSIRVDVLVLGLQEGQQPDDFADGDCRIVAAGQHHPVEQLPQRAELALK